MISDIKFDKLLDATWETLYLTIIVSFFVFIVGVFIGFLLYGLSSEKLFYNKLLYNILSNIVNIFRSIPFIILLIILMPVTKVIMGTIIGPNAALLALTFSIAPFYSRLVETALNDINRDIIELGLSLGLTKFQILFKLVLKEASPAIVSNFTTTIISIISFSAMAGVIGAGGLGSLAYLDGFQRSNEAVTIAATIVILVIVFITQAIGLGITKKIDHR